MAITYERGYVPGPSEPYSDVGPVSAPTLDDLRGALPRNAGPLPSYLRGPRSDADLLAEEIGRLEEPGRQLAGALADELSPGSVAANFIPLGWFSRAKASAVPATRLAERIFTHRANSMPKRLPVWSDATRKSVEAAAKRVYMTGAELAELTAARAKEAASTAVRILDDGRSVLMADGSVRTVGVKGFNTVGKFLADHYKGTLGTAAVLWAGLTATSALYKGSRRAADAAREADAKRRADDAAAANAVELASLFSKTNSPEGIASIYQSEDTLNDYARRLMQGLARRQSLSGDASDDGTAASLKAYVDTMNFIRSASRPDGGDYSAAFDEFLGEGSRPIDAPAQFKGFQDGIAANNAAKLRQSSQEENP